MAAMTSNSIRQLGDQRALDVVLNDENGNIIESLEGPAPATSVQTNVASAAVSTVLLAANPNRRKFLIYNDSSKSLKVMLGAGASLTVFSFILGSQGVYESAVGDYAGEVTGIWLGAVGFARVTEITA